MKKTLGDLTGKRAHLLGMCDDLKRLHQEYQYLLKRWDTLLGTHYVVARGESQLEVSSDTIKWEDLSQEIHDDDLNDIRDQIVSHGPLKLILLGGSGVGKSTLINALAGREISSTSHLTRAHTAGFVIYTHHTWRQWTLAELAPSWPHELLEVCERIEHDHSGLKEIWIIDAPDIDTVNSAHRIRTLTALSEADLPMVVTSPQKYRDESYMRILSSIDKRRSVVFIMNQLDTVWPEQREELMFDAQMFSDEIGFDQVTWIGVDAKEDRVQSISDALSHHTLVGIQAIRTLLESHLDDKEAERLRSGRFVQRLTEILYTFSLPLALYEELAQLFHWQEQLVKGLTPLLAQYLSLSHELKRNDTNPYTSLNTIKQNKAWIGLPIHLCWCLMIRSEDHAQSTLPLARVHNDAYLRCRVFFIRHCRELPAVISIKPEIYSDFRTRIDQAYDTIQKQPETIMDQTVMLTTPELIRLGRQQWLVSSIITLIVGFGTSWSIMVMLICLSISLWGVAQWKLTRLRIQQGTARSVRPHFNLDATQIARQLSHDILANDERWLRLVSSRDQIAETFDDRQLKMDCEKYLRSYEDLKHSLSVM